MPTATPSPSNTPIPPTNTPSNTYASLIQTLLTYQAETHHGAAHVERWTRALAALGHGSHANPMTLAEAQGYAQQYSSARWQPVVDALTQLQPPPPPPTNTPIPPTNTSVPPTATPIPPTNTPVPPTATPIPPTNTPMPPTNTPIPQPTHLFRHHRQRTRRSRHRRQRTRQCHSQAIPCRTASSKRCGTITMRMSLLAARARTGCAS